MKKRDSNVTLTRGLRVYLYLTAAVTGGVIMIVEILGAKMLAPYLGTSHFVWTAQIAVTLVALACGYYVGGRWVDRSPRLGQLYAAILAAAVYLCVTIPIHEQVAYAFLHLNLAVASLLTSMFLFFVPLALLATVGPFFARLITASVGEVGGNVGRLTALGTLGSFVGTILIGYLLIPLLPNSVIMYSTAIALMALVAGYFWGFTRRFGVRLVFVLAALAGAAIGYCGLQGGAMPSHIEEIQRCNSYFGLLQVVQVKDTQRRYLLNDYLVQNTYDPKLRKSASMFTYMLHGLARAYTKQIDDVLCIGLGIGIVPMEFAREGARVDVVEINPSVVPLAVRHFDLQQDKINLYIGDGRYFISRCTKQYDAVILDAFLGDSSPSHLLTREAFESISRVLKREGALVMNIFGSLPGENDFFTASLTRTLQTVFRSVRVHQGDNRNTFLVASNQQELSIVRKPQLELVHLSVRAAVEEAFAGILAVDTARGMVLTDDYNPVEYYDARNREVLRRLFALEMKGL